MSGRGYTFRVALLLLALTAPVRQAAALECPRPQTAAAPLRLAPAYRHGLLWRVQRDGVAPSYIFGTIHLGDPRIVHLASPVEKAFDHAGSLTVETVLDDAGVLAFSSAMYYRDGRTLRRQLGPGLYAEAVKRLAAYGISSGTADHMKPWAVYVTLSLPPHEHGLPLDMRLMARAKQRGVPVYGLESVKEQTAVLNDLAPSDQVRLVRDAVCDYSEIQTDIAHMKRLYLDRDLGDLYTFANRYDVGERKLYQRVLGALLWRRNTRMVRRMAPRLAAGNAFIAIGALHLPGARGVLGLLKARGFTVTPVY